MKPATRRCSVLKPGFRHSPNRRQIQSQKSEGTHGRAVPAKSSGIAGSLGAGSPVPLKPRLSPWKISVPQEPRGEKAIRGRPSQSAVLTRGKKGKPKDQKNPNFARNHHIRVESGHKPDTVSDMDLQLWSDLIEELGKHCDSINHIIGLAVAIAAGLGLMRKKESGDVDEEKNPMYVLS